MTKRHCHPPHRPPRLAAYCSFLPSPFSVHLGPTEPQYVGPLPLDVWVFLLLPEVCLMPPKAAVRDPRAGRARTSIPSVNATSQLDVA